MPSVINVNELRSGRNVVISQVEDSSEGYPRHLVNPETDIASMQYHMYLSAGLATIMTCQLLILKNISE